MIEDMKVFPYLRPPVPFFCLLLNVRSNLSSNCFFPPPFLSSSFFPFFEFAFAFFSLLFNNYIYFFLPMKTINCSVNIPTLLPTPTMLIALRKQQKANNKRTKNLLHLPLLFRYSFNVK